MDFIFGTLATDELKLVHHRANRRGIQHRYQSEPRDPRPGEPVTLHVSIGPDLAIEHVACYYTLDGSLPVGHCGTARHGQVVMFSHVETVWETLVWGYVAHYQATLPPQPDGTMVRYKIGAWSEGQPEVFGDWPNVTATAEKAASAFFAGQPLPEDFRPGNAGIGDTFALQVDTLTPPMWAKDAIIYHIFVDRFYPGDGKEWLQTEDLNGICGGTLWGVIDKLDYVIELGATCIWLSPTWPSPSHHGYDTIDYCRVEPRMGGDEAMRALVEAAHARGVRILLDLACNHISSDHPIFKEALSSPTSPYRAWFNFDDSEIGYRTFFGVATMPQVNLTHPVARKWMIDIATFWLHEYGIDGYRLDYANGPSPDFWSDFRAACKQVKPDCLLFGEIIDAPDVVQSYIGRLDGSLDFHLSDALRRTYGWQTWSEAEFERFAQRHLAYFPQDFLMPIFLDNHDMDRFLFIAGGNLEALRRASEVQMSLPGIPIIFYGTEVGLSQATSTRDGFGLHISRTPMLWGDEQNAEMLAHYKQLIRDRRGRQG